VHFVVDRSTGGKSVLLDLLGGNAQAVTGLRVGAKIFNRPRFGVHDLEKAVIDKGRARNEQPAVGELMEIWER